MKFSGRVIVYWDWLMNDEVIKGVIACRVVALLH